MKGRIIGIVVLLVIVAGALLYQFVFRKGAISGAALTGKTQTMKGLVGSEKTGFLDDEEVKGILRRRFGIVVDYGRAGSIEMVQGPVSPDTDFLWPSSQVALEIYRIARDNAPVKSEIIFSSPIVIYSWQIVVNALAKAGLVTESGGTASITDFPKLVAWVAEGKKWAEAGLPELYGKVAIISTDPNKSNSGALFAGLVANILNGDVVDEKSLQPLLPRMRSVFSRLGYMENSTGILFEQYLRAGVGSYPMIVGYENQIVEFSLQHTELWPKVKDTLRILYPVPTVWSSHPFIAVTPRARALMDALRDPELQKIAWEKHGFRTGIADAQNDPKVLAITGIAEAVRQIMPTPIPAVMEQILAALRGGAQ
jgi:hypothetical protein